MTVILVPVNPFCTHMLLINEGMFELITFLLHFDKKIKRMAKMLKPDSYSETSNTSQTNSSENICFDIAVNLKTSYVKGEGNANVLPRKSLI